MAMSEASVCQNPGYITALATPTTSNITLPTTEPTYHTNPADWTHHMSIIASVYCILAIITFIVEHIILEKGSKVNLKAQ